MSENTELRKSWIQETGIEGRSEGENNNPLSEFTFLKVYNPMMWEIPDIEKDGQIVALWEDGWVPFWKELKNVEVLDLTKCYKWYATKLENGTPVTDDSGKAMKELYYTPEVSVFDKGNIAIAKNSPEGPVVLGKWGFKWYIDFTTSMQLEDKTLNPLFSTIGTNSQTWEKYPISIMKQEYYMYFQMDGKLYKIRLWASYGRWKDIQDGTFLHAKNEWMKAFKEAYPTMRFEFHYLTLKASVEKADKYKFLNWSFDSITENSVMEPLNKTRDAVSNLNTQNFPGVTVGNGMESLEFKMNRLAIEAPKKVTEPKEATVETGDISLEDVPF